MVLDMCLGGQIAIAMVVVVDGSWEGGNSALDGIVSRDS